MVRVLFVCLGNICRSPMGEGILLRMVKDQNLDVEVDSAGTGDWHVGDPPDHRAVKEGRKRNCEMRMRGRQFASADFERFDLIVVMDHMNLRDLERWPGYRPGKVRLASSFDPQATKIEVPDPYYGTAHDFEKVADMLERACAGIVRELDLVEAKQ